MQISNAGTPTPTADPPDPEANQANQTHISARMDMDNTTLEGGIKDDDLSKQMLQEWEDSNSQPSDMSDSPEANRKKND